MKRTNKHKTKSNRAEKQRKSAAAKAVRALPAQNMASTACPALTRRALSTFDAQKQLPININDFNAPLVPIEAFAPRADFPACALGIFVDLHGFTGVVVELVGRSLKVRSPQVCT